MLQTLLNKKAMSFDKERWRVFGNWLKTQRENAKLSQDGLADLIDVDRQTIYRLENALSGTKRETVLALAEALKASESEALLKAGFASQGLITDSHEILKGVTVQFDHSIKLSNDEKEKIIEAMKLVAEGVRARQENKE
jgi:transcriptional regulator with XRE-family HTH domain